MKPNDPLRRRRAIEARPPRQQTVSHTPLGSGGEFDVIRRMLERWGPRSRGIGDDAAVITTIGDRALVISTDTSVENVHFRRSWLSSEEIGYRATAAALSDVAAMGATPLGVLVAMTVPDAWRSDIDAIADGIGEAASSCDAPIMGGDLSRGAELSLTLTVLGTARSVLCRTAARPGDRVYVTGSLGGPSSALKALLAGRTPSAEALQRFARPTPRILEAIWLSEHGATCAIDISDGFAADLGHIAAASRVKIKVHLDRLSVFEGVSPLEAAGSGEEYELIVTSPIAIDEAEFRETFGIEFSEVGAVETGTHGIVTYLDGAQVEPPPGYLHFASAR